MTWVAKLGEFGPVTAGKVKHLDRFWDYDSLRQQFRLISPSEFQADLKAWEEVTYPLRLKLERAGAFSAFLNER